MWTFMHEYPAKRMTNAAGKTRWVPYNANDLKRDFPDVHGSLALILNKYGDDNLRNGFFSTHANHRSLSRILKSLNNYSLFIETAGLHFSKSLYKLRTDFIRAGVYNNMNTLDQAVDSENCKLHIPVIVISKAFYDDNKYENPG